MDVLLHKFECLWV